jgi:hypothetical protein
MAEGTLWPGYGGDGGNTLSSIHSYSQLMSRDAAELDDGQGGWTGGCRVKLLDGWDDDTSRAANKHLLCSIWSG